MYDKFSRTDKTIMFAFQRVLGKKAYDDVNIIDVCKEADIQRMTFYNHFENKDRLFQIILSERQNEAIKRAQERAKDNSYKAFVDELLDIMFDTIENEKDRIRFYIVANEKTTNNAIMIKNSATNSFRKIYKLYSDKIKTKIDPKISALLISEGLTKLFKDWLTGEIDMDNKEMKTTVKQILLASVSQYEKTKDEEICR